jgi:hypothetical protein
MCRAIEPLNLKMIYLPRGEDNAHLIHNMVKNISIEQMQNNFLQHLDATRIDLSSYAQDIYLQEQIAG